MCAGIVRIGDLVSCDDHAGSGSGDVFSDGMPIVTQKANATTGHGCFPPTIFIGPWSTTVFVNDSPIALKGITKIKVHRCGKKSHDGVAVVDSGSVEAES